MRLVKNITTIMSFLILIFLSSTLLVSATSKDLTLDDITISLDEQKTIIKELRSNYPNYSSYDLYNSIGDASDNYFMESDYTKQENYDLAKKFIETFYNINYETVNIEEYSHFMAKYTKDTYGMNSKNLYMVNFWRNQLDIDKNNKLKMESLFFSSPDLVYNYQNKTDKNVIRGILYFKVNSFIGTFKINGCEIKLNKWYQMDIEILTKTDSVDKYLTYDSIKFLTIPKEKLKIEE